MNKKNPKALGKLKTFLAVTLSCSMVLGVVAVADALYPTKDNEAKAATTTSSVLGDESTAAGLTKISVGDTIQFPGVTGVNGQTATAKACKTNDGSIEMVFENVGTHGTWPGQNYSAAASSWGDTTQNFHSTYSYAVSGNYYLLPTSNPNDNEREALKTAAGMYSSFGAGNIFAWLGTPGGSGAYGVNSNGDVYGYDTSSVHVLAPAFNLKASYAWKIGNSFAKNVGGSAAISATHLTSVNSWETPAVTSIITNVTNGVTGTKDKYTVDSELGYINGSNYIPTVRSDNVTDTLTVRSVDNAGFTAKTFSLTVVGADVQVTSDTLEAGTSYDLSFVASSKTDGMVITDTQNWISGDKYIVPGSARDLTDTFKFTIGNTLIASKDVKIKANQNIQMDDEGYYIYTDDNNIEWHFKYNDAGQIDYLFASSANIGKLVTNDESKTLTVPSTINGVTVAGIGTDGSSHNFLNDTDGATGSTVWKNIYIPSSVKTIRGYAFAGCKASAKVEIPSTVQAISKHAFDGSSITEVKFDDASKLTIGEEAFANNTNLTSVILRGNGCSIGKKAFYGTGITKLNIPSGTTFGADSNAFSHNEALAELKVDMTTVPNNSFVDTPALAKVTFGENVKQVNALWTGKKAEASGTIANRTTYALGADTIFNCSKANESTYYSPFGIGGTLNVYGLKSEQVFNNGSGPVYAFNNGANNAYAKGEADSEETHICTTTSSMDGLGDSDVTEQDGIEASYSGTLLGGSNATTAASTLNKDNMTVRKLFGEDANGTYSSDEFYVMRSQTFDDEVKGKSFSGYTTEGNVNTIKDSDTMLEFYKSVDKVQVNDTDVSNGALTVTVVVLKTAEYDGKTYYLASQQKDGSAKMDIFTCEVTIPVKKYSDYNLFSDVYGGDFTKIAQAITDAQAKNDKLQADLTAKEAEATKLQTQLDAINKKLSEAGITPKTDDNGNVDVSGAVETLEKQKADLEKQIKDLKAQIGVSDDTDVAALKAQITTLKKQSDDYAALLSQYQSVIEKLQAGKGPVASDVKSDTITTGDVTVTNDVPAGTYVYGDDGKWHEGSKDGKVVDGITTGDKIPNSGDTITVKVNDKPALTEDELKTLDGSNVIDTLEAQLAEQKQKTAAAEANYKALKDQTDKSAAEAQKNLEEAQKQQAEIQSQLEAAKKAKEEADKTLNDANATAEEKQAALQKQVDTLNTQVESLTKTNKEQGDKLTELQGNVASLGAQVSQYKDISDTVAKVAGIDVKGKSAAEVKEALSNMANEYVADKKAISTIAEATGQDPAKVASDPDAFAKTVTDKIGSGSSSSDDATVKALNEKIAELTSQNKTLQDKLNSSSNSGNSGSTSDNSGSSNSNTDSTAVTTLSAQLSTAQTKASMLQDQLTSLTAEKAKLESENDALNDKVTELSKNASDTSDTDTSDYKAQISELKAANKSLTSKNKTLNSRNKTLTSTNKSLASQLKSAKKNVKTVTRVQTVRVPVTKTVTVPGQTQYKTVTKTEKKYVNQDGTITDEPKNVKDSSDDDDKKSDSKSGGSMTIKSVTPTTPSQQTYGDTTTTSDGSIKDQIQQSQTGSDAGSSTDLPSVGGGDSGNKDKDTDKDNPSDKKKDKDNDASPLPVALITLIIVGGALFILNKKGLINLPFGSSSKAASADDDADDVLDDDGGFDVDDSFEEDSDNESDDNEMVG